MKRFRVRRPSAPMAVAFVALIAALSGTAAALPGHNSVKSDDIKNGQVKSADIKNSGVLGKDIKGNTVKGSDIDESSLGTVPSASTAGTASAAAVAGTAQKVNGLTKISFRAPAGTAITPIYNAGGLLLKAGCDAGGNLSYTMETTVNNAAVFGDTHDHDGPDNNADTEPSQDDFDTGDVVDLLLHSSDGQGFEINYSNPNGTEIFVKTQNWEGTGFGAACQVGGIATLIP